MKDVTYKGYYIRARSYEISAGWTIDALVSLTEGIRTQWRPLTCDKIFKTQEKADDYSVEMSKAWIDDQ